MNHKHLTMLVECWSGRARAVSSLVQAIDRAEEVGGAPPPIPMEICVSSKARQFKGHLGADELK